ncbi:MAG: ABC-2 family transporter protein [Oscillospiraceae bacterium]|nr:ABC-2 family transporter protein [Oscillospiraceae bacterium]
MRKYAAVAQTLFKAQIIYRFDVILTAVGTIWRVVFAWILWGAIFADHSEIGGFTFQAMLSYYVINAFLSTMERSHGTLGEISNKIRDGSFTKFMVIPSNTQLHFLSQTIGASAYYGVFAVMATAVSMLLFRINLTLTGDITRILLAVVMFLLGTVFMNSYSFFVGIWAFKFQDMTFAMHLLPSVVSFFKGELVPLSLLPEVFVHILRWFPFTHIIYTPTMLLTGMIDASEGLYGLAILCIWTLGMFLVSQLTYRKMRIKYEGVGI